MANSPANAKGGPRPAFSVSLKFGVLYEIDIVLVLLGHLVIVEREALRDPADQEPEAAEKYEKLQDSVDTGIGFPGFSDPPLIQVVGALINPFGIEYNKHHLSHSHGKKPGDADMVEQDPVEPLHGVHEGEKYFPGTHHDAKEFIVRIKDKSADGEKTYHPETDEGSQFPSHIDPADHVHHKENQEQGSDGREEIGTQMVKGGILHAVGCMDQYIRKDEGPREKGNIPDAPERVEQAFSRHELGKEKEEETLSHVPAETVPFEKSGNPEKIIPDGDDSKQHKGAEEIGENFLQ